MSNYLIELSVIHLSLVLAYWLFLRNESQYKKMRIYLIGSTLLALIIPLLKLPKLFFQTKPESTVSTAMEIPIEAMEFSPPASNGFNPNILIGIYCVITAAFLIKFLANIYQLYQLERSSQHELYHDLEIRKVRNIEGSFTFFHWIFLSEEISRDQQEYDVILRHEQAHASLGHTYDLLLFELFKVAFWWLPSAWFLQKEIKKIHE